MKHSTGDLLNVLAVVALVPTMVDGRGGSSYFRRQQAQADPHGEASPEALEDRGRRQRNFELIKQRKKLELPNLFKAQRRLRTDVIIGGVGYAGAKLGEVLSQSDGINFVMLEASDRIGGRVNSMLFGDGDEKHSIELGATWLAGINGSPNWDLAIESSLQGSFDDGSLEIYASNGERNFTEELFEEGSECLAVDVANYYTNRISDKCIKLNEGDPVRARRLCNAVADDGVFIPKDDDDVSIRQVYDDVVNYRVPERPSPSHAGNCEFYYNQWVQGVEIEEISVNNSIPLATYIDFGDGDYFVNDVRGYAWLPKFLCGKYLQTSVNTQNTITFNDERLKMNHKITKVRWDPEGKEKVVVEGCFTERVDEPNSPPLFPCKRGKENKFKIKANEFVSTFSQSVLRESIRLELENVSLKDSVDIAPRFLPSLTENIEGIEVLLDIRIGMDNKAFFQFPKKFWTNAGYLLSAYSQGSYVGTYAPIWINRDLAKSDWEPDSNILILNTVGNRAYEVDQMSEENLIEQVLPVLNGMFQDNIVTLYGGNLTRADISDFYMTRWSVDPLFYGAYDAQHINITEAQREIFGKRYGNLVLSGSYSCSRHQGYAHGALLAGERTGILLLKERYGYDDLDTNNICDDGTGRS